MVFPATHPEENPPSNFPKTETGSDSFISGVFEHDKTEATLTQVKASLNHCNQWTTDKVATGSSIHATSDNTTGNVANAQAAAQKSAQMVSGLVMLVCSRNIQSTL